MIFIYFSIFPIEKSTILYYTITTIKKEWQNGMLRQIVFEDEITLWWERRFALPENGAFFMTLNGKKHGKTTKTHYTFKNLQPDTEYAVTISIIDGNGRNVNEWQSMTVKTSKKKKRLDITKEPYNCVGDGVTVNTAALQKALDDCQEHESVYLPKGIYITGALNVHSNTEIYLEKDAVLQGTGIVEDYSPRIKSRFEGTERECYRSLLNLGELDRDGGYNCVNVTIRGGGTVSGGGEVLCWATIESEREKLKEFLAQNGEYIKTCENANTLPGRVRGRLINMSNCKNVTLAGVTLQYGPAWNIHMIYSKDITAFGCKIESTGVWNGDGWDPDSSENCVVFDTEFCTHDDAIAIKSGKNPEGNTINRPTKNVYVFDCRGRNGIAVGSEMSGGIDGVYVWDCDFSVSHGGMILKTTRKRGGFIRNVFVRDSIFNSFTVYTDLPYNNDGESAPTLPKIKNVNLDNVTLTGVRTFVGGRKEKVDCIELYGLEEDAYHLENVALRNITIVGKEETHGFKIKNVKNLVMENINFVKSIGK